MAKLDVRVRYSGADDRGSVAPESFFVGLIVIVGIVFASVVSAATGASAGVAAAVYALSLVAVAVLGHVACRRYQRRSLLDLLYGVEAIAPVDDTQAGAASAVGPGPSGGAACGRE